MFIDINENIAGISKKCNYNTYRCFLTSDNGITITFLRYNERLTAVRKKLRQTVRQLNHLSDD